MNIAGPIAVTAVKNVLPSRRQGGPQKTPETSRTRDIGSGGGTSQSRAKTAEARAVGAEASLAARIHDTGVGNAAPVKAPEGAGKLQRVEVDAAGRAAPRDAMEARLNGTEAPIKPLEAPDVLAARAQAQAAKVERDNAIIANSGGTETQMSLSAMARKATTNGNAVMRAYGR